jgi:hypothetical protein
MLLPNNAASSSRRSDVTVNRRMKLYPPCCLATDKQSPAALCHTKV